MYYHFFILLTQLYKQYKKFCAQNRMSLVKFVVCNRFSENINIFLRKMHINKVDERPLCKQLQQKNRKTDCAE